MRKRNLFVVLSLAFVVSLVPTSSPADAATPPDEEAPTLLGFATGPDWREDLPDFASEAGKFPAFHEVFRTVDSGWSHAWLPAFFQDAHDWGMVSWLVTHVDDLASFSDGGHDADLNAMVAFFKNWMQDDQTKRLVVAPFPEPNLIGHAWSEDPTSYRDAFVRIHDAFRNAGLGPERVRFAFVMNGISSSGFSYSQFYPGDGYVDILSFNKHNRNIAFSSDDPWRDYEETFGRHIEEMSREISRSKPIFINQTGSVDDDQDRRAGWLKDMFAGLKAHDQVIGAGYLNRTKNENGGVSDFRVLVDGVLDPAFRDGYQTWSEPAAAAWIFDGKMDRWVADREASLETGFVDVPSNHLFVDSIRWLSDNGITRGCNPPTNDRFCPDGLLTRGEMAAMLTRALSLPMSQLDFFIDDETSVFESDINRLAEAGITRGCNPPSNNRFCPQPSISRGEMAAFMVRAFAYPAAGSGDPFTDDDGNVFEDDIERLRAAGVTLGCNPPKNDRYCPDDPVTRGQMAAFLYRAFH